LPAAIHTGYAPDLLPSSPNAGECYARVEIPAQYSTSSEHIIVEQGYSHIEVTQPQLAPREENVLVKEASVKYRVRQPTYRSVTEQMMVRPAYDKLSVSRPSFSTVTETIQTSAPRLVWKRGNPGKLRAQGYTIHSTADAGRYGKGYTSTAQYGTSGGQHCGATCEIWCLVEEPGESVKFNRKVMTNPGQVTRHQVPAKYQTIHKQVVSDPGGVEEIPVPAEYRTVTVEDVIHPGGEREVHVPPKYGEVATKTLIAPARYEWRRVLCKPGTGTIRSGGSHASSSHSTGSYTSGSTYSSGSSYTSSGTAYTGGTVQMYQGGTTSHTTHPSRTYGDMTSSHGHHSHDRHHHKAKRKRKRWH